GGWGGGGGGGVWGGGRGGGGGGGARPGWGGGGGGTTGGATPEMPARGSARHTPPATRGAACPEPVDIRAIYRARAAGGNVARASAGLRGKSREQLVSRFRSSQRSLSELRNRRGH